MRTVNIGALKNQLSAYLQYVRRGEEVIVKDRNKPVARILPFETESLSEVEARLVAEGKLKLPERRMDWDEFFALPKANVPREVAVRAVTESRGDR
ncbi:MAG: type II toxin-antitoxin system Phd/YefM family antitoxin [Acidobacteriota bacterium]